MYYLAIDIGASSGRHIIGYMRDGELVTEEMYRFPNGMIKNEQGTLVWDIDALFRHVKQGISECVKAGRSPDFIGIDTWGVDYVLLDGDGNRTGEAIGYRDSRNIPMDKEVFKLVPENELYERTGIQKAVYNTIYQLTDDRLNIPERLENAEALLFIPEYLNYLLTGVMMNEYTIASTSQLLNAKTRDWDRELIGKLGLPQKIFGRIYPSGTVVGNLKNEIAAETGCSGKVILPACHDTGSAVAAVPSNEKDVIYISSGTWSLIGVEKDSPDCSDRSRRHNFTNEGGVENTYRYLKNITGMWMIQSMKKEIGGDHTFDELCDMAREFDSIPNRVDPNDPRFLAPENMSEEVAKAAGLESPAVGQLFAVVYHSLAESYSQAVKEIEELTCRNMNAIHIVGGGCKDDYLNTLTAKKCGKTVYAGPKEATAIGNLAVQMIASGEFKDLGHARKVIFDSFGVKKY